MKYKLIARDRTFCEGTLAECKNALTGVSNMISAGFTTSFQLEEFVIISINCQGCNCEV